ncbi:MAG TPA: hypothetical protein ENK65_02620 [Helicobacteraceae bacterium]|nr:hypothetical protein [Helicobacteraceae bacterium]
MQRIATWLTPIIAIGVALFITIFLVEINNNEPVPSLNPTTKSAENSTNEESAQPRWLDKLAKSERLGYFYPVNEISIELDLDEKQVSEAIYKLSAPLKDPYQLFCLKQELKQHQLRYYLEKDGDGAELLIFSKDIKRLKALVKALKNYKISANISPYKEDKRWKKVK